MTELTPEARALVEQLRADDRPANVDPDVMLASVLREVSAAPATRATTASSIVTRLALGTLGLGLIVGAAWLVTGTRNGPVAARESVTATETETETETETATATRPPPPHPPSPVPGEGGATEHRAEEPVSVPSAPAPVVVPQAPQRTTRSSPSHAPLAARRDPPPAEPVVPVAPTSVVQPVAAPTETGDGLLGEIRLLHEAQSALAAHDPTRALARLDEHAARYPRGTLRQESLAERVVALCQLGRTDEARALAAPLLRENTRSPAVERVRASCVGNAATP